jgi:dCMP deaminase
MIIIGTFSVIHKGYLDILDKYPTADIFVLGPDLSQELYKLELDLRQMPFAKIKNLLANLGKTVTELTKENLNIISDADQIILIKDNITDELKNKYFSDKNNIIEENGFFYHQADNVFKTNADQPDTTISVDQTDLKYMNQAQELAKSSGCFWRQIGAVVVKNDQIIYQAYNEMLPNNDECYKIGCIRDGIKPGTQTEFCSVAHAEAKCVATAAKDGTSLKDTAIYVTTFPCPACAKLIALSGIKKCFYNQGWANFDGERVMQSAGVQIIKVNI